MSQATKGWVGLATIPVRRFTCGHCGVAVGAKAGYYYEEAPSPSRDNLRGVAGPNQAKRFAIPCPSCDSVSYFNEGKQVPGPPYGRDVASAPSPVADVYREARNCMTVAAHTGAVMLCRKLLMNVAVAKGAAGNLKFIEYVEWLDANGYIPPNGKGWVDYMRKKGNEATHEIHVSERGDAEKLITFAEMILMFVYELPAAIA